MTTSTYKLDTRYTLVDTDIINDKKNIIYTDNHVNLITKLEFDK